MVDVRDEKCTTSDFQTWVKKCTLSATTESRLPRHDFCIGLKLDANQTSIDMKRLQRALFVLTVGQIYG